MAEYVTVKSPTGARREKATDAILDHILVKREREAAERLMDTWKLNYCELLCEQMLVESEPDRTSMIHEMLFVIRGS